MKNHTLPESAGICGVRFLNQMAIDKDRLPDFAKKEISDCSKAIARDIPWDTWRERIEGNLGVSTDALIALGFKPWSDEGDMELWLFPYWLLPFIPDGFPVVAIDGEKLNFNKDDADDDIRFGVLTYGIEVPRPQKVETK